MRQSGRARRLLLAAIAGAALQASVAAKSQEPAAATPPVADPLLARGELIFNIGGCTSCHTAKDGQRLAGGDPIVSPFGTFYAPNITPDAETGIGGWTGEEFARAMREGISPDGSPYYPAFPYTSFTLMTDEDVAALKAYLDTVPPVRQAARDHELGFPYNIRMGLNLWQWLHFEPGRFEPDASRDEAWNRGAYLVNGPGHCQQCHTPRTWTGALAEERAFTGNDLGKQIGKSANITSDPKVGIGNWSEGDLLVLLQLGMTPDGDFVGGEMAKVVSNATSKLPEADRRAIVTYLRSLPAR